MKVKISYTDDTEPRFTEIETIEGLICITQEEGNDVMISQRKPKDADLEVIVYNDYLW